jgi:hypothetical protein
MRFVAYQRGDAVDRKGAEMGILEQHGNAKQIGLCQ